MTESIKSDSVSELRQLMDELAARSMSEFPVDECEARVICERFSMLHRLASEAELSEVAALGQSLQKSLISSNVTDFVPALRDAVTQMQGRLDAPPARVPELSGASDDVGISDPGLIADFIVESREHLVGAEELALALEKDPGNLESVNALFRGFHSIKGLAAFLEFDRVYRFSHEVETLLDYARNQELTITPAVIDLILAAADFLSRCMDAIQAGSLANVPAIEEPLVERIRTTIEQCAKPASTTESAAIETALEIEAPSSVENAAPSPEPAAKEVAEVKAQSVHSVGTKDAAVVVTPKKATAPSATAASTPDTPPEAQRAAVADSAAPTARKGQAAEQYSIRVETSKLDYLMDMVGELVIAESLVRTEVSETAQPNSPLLRSITQLTQITSEVQRTTFRMRMIPIGQLLRRTARIVRDLSRKFGKQVEVEFEGEETEVDKTIAEELADPLMHIVRNAIDHGIELPEVRIAAGKPPVAKIRLAASHDGSQIVVEVSDDGKGLDKEKILKKAREKKLVTDSQLSDADIVELIFKPGFSTAEQLTTVSGRGVGMDVVRRQVEKLRGRVDVESKPGSGTRFTIRLPLTRAIIDGLVVKVGGSRYVLPMSCVREIFRPAESSVSTVQSRGELVLLHDRLLPLLRVHREFDLPSAVTNPWEAVLIVAESEGRRFCLMVDELIGKQEVVVKSLGHFLKDTKGVSGGTILGDGRVGLILDVQQIEVRA
jgi:two-component system, chemotaxis family, sensor kinase CheA